MKIYRNVYFLKNIFKEGDGNKDIQYYGNIYSNAKQIKDFNKLFDRNQDIIINCSDCFKHKYGKLIKVKRK